MKYTILIIASLFFFDLTAEASASSVGLPAPIYDPPSLTNKDRIIVAGGCFWGVQAVFEHMKGVKKAISGYAGGDKSTAHYELVGNGNTGHAEAVEISFDPKIVTLGQILQVFFSVAHDPTQLNRQGPDHGTQYRSAIFTTSGQQNKVAAEYISQLNKINAFSQPIVTRIEKGMTFYPAESYHQDYAFYNPDKPYIIINDLPKVSNLKQMYPLLYREKPVLSNAKDE
jgi:peptide-methionine (S)-S-oxide reductase